MRQHLADSVLLTQKWEFHHLKFSFLAMWAKTCFVRVPKRTKTKSIKPCPRVAAAPCSFFIRLRLALTCQLLLLKYLHFATSFQIFRIGLLFPLFSLSYMVCPWTQFSQRLRKPFIKFIAHSSSYIFFLGEWVTTPMLHNETSSFQLSVEVLYT